ncbi:uncharacterized protein F5Z01DRAFT_639878 [Emericellopsis atlantica]|uniref:C2H2-type domain-containing protein n=1 Tax=Emericellopsis atlantica TaxID=2614577 RepID=A0A9P7ZFU4_9HYPO|nr:uncharacterized protein F5Z01DRAFT_639878 [Emericellopsis atlantica]KAG9250790.1 hypothetical protein F5Z01DRAFT_639878 [Emericellopsis atlantica]
MDLTPPSLTNSPNSPHRKASDSPPYTMVAAGCSPDIRSSDYATFSDFDSVCGLSSQSYEPLIDPELTQAVDVGSPFASLDSVPASVSWTTPDVSTAPSPTMSTTSTMPATVSPDYGKHLGAYDSPCLPTAPAYPIGGGIARNATRSPPLVRTSPDPSPEAKSRGASSFASSRGSFSYVSSSLPSKSRMESSISYRHVHEPTHYPHPGPLTLKSQTGVQIPYSHIPHMLLPMESSANQANVLGTFHRANPTQLVRNADTSPSASLLDSSVRNWSRVKKAKRRPTRRHTTQEEANFQCQVRGCGKFFSRSYNFKSHMETHDNRREYPFPCEVPHCTKRFVRKTDLQRHHQSVHSKERNHKCDYCGRLFARKDTLRRHMEDGCSKRFEVGMLEAPSGDYAAKPTRSEENVAERNSGPPPHPLPPPPSTGAMLLTSINNDSQALF